MTDEFNRKASELQSNQSGSSEPGGEVPGKDDPAPMGECMLHNSQQNHKSTDCRTGIKTTEAHYSWQQVYHLLNATRGGHE